ncbi:HD domain-containing protein [Segetibacter koreensis]|uniref:HD domain-containing protein n=1 Tax=Segetibacter koreensis TaxID=398037 RepID=UPI000375EF26|nr:HD domain-containing protein [Segetibacter koreensis]
MLLFVNIKQHVIDKLEKGLSPDLTYHNVTHTLDVLEQAVDIAKYEGIKNENDLLLLKIGALYHDVGFLNVYTGHEKVSCEIAYKELLGFGYSEDQINTICGIIKATKVPQRPKTILEKIICDADLDYLGRDDFFKIGEGLYKEFLYQRIVSDSRSWNFLQVSFLKRHHYFTETTKQRRQKQKKIHLEILKSKLY